MHIQKNIYITIILLHIILYYNFKSIFENHLKFFLDNWYYYIGWPLENPRSRHF